jgi:hypothetical protein
VDGDPSGSVQFFSGPTLIGKAPLTPSTLLDVTSTATLNTANGASSAVYSGDANFQGSTSACRYTLSPTQIDAPPVGASGTIAATTSCPVIALSDQTWVTATPSGSSVAYTVEANHGTSPRTATLTVGSVTVPVTQDVFSLCDLKQNGSVNVADVQLIVNQALGVTPAVNYLQGAGAAVNVVDVQIEINAALGLGCTAK